MANPLKLLVPKLIALVKQLSEKNLDLEKQLAIAFSNPADKAAAEAAETRAKAAEELNTSLTTRIAALEERVKAEDLEDEEDASLAAEIEPYLSQESSTPPKPLEVEPPSQSKGKIS